MTFVQKQNLDGLSVSNLSFHYPSSELTCRSLLNQISFNVPSFSLLHLQGHNGSGKTSLLKLFAGLLRPDEGIILYNGNDIWSNIIDYQQKISYLGHKNGIHPNLTVWEQVQFDTECQNLHLVTQGLHDLKLWSSRDHLCVHLSAGQKRRLALLRVIVSSAFVWLLDEPLTALDAHGMTFLQSAIQNHIAHKGIVIYTSHQSLPCSDLMQLEYTL